jgi:alcohol oxidase
VCILLQSPAQFWDNLASEISETTMPIYERITKGLEEVDVIIAGGGTAGCVVAGRLAAADPSLEVLVIEGGENNYQKDNIVNAALFREHLAPTSRTALFYMSTKQPQLAGREVVTPAGGILGGGSSINIALYSRPYADDLDSWNTEGWSADELLPFLRKFETYHGIGKEELHGRDGPIQVSDGGFKVAHSQSDIIRAAEAVGYPEVPDLQDLHSGNNVEKALRWVSPNGNRQDAAHTFIHPLLQDGKHPNLHVLCQSKVIRVVFDEHNRAIGVESTPNSAYQVELNLTMHPKSIIKARKMVILSAGACGTPSVLERSGVGDRQVLEKANVDVVADVPGVGHDYQDHHLIFWPYKTSLAPDETLDTLFDGRTDRSEAIANNNPLLRWNACDVAAKIRPTDQEATALGKDFQEMWERDFKSKPQRPLMCLVAVSR